MKIYKIPSGILKIGVDEKGTPFYLKKELLEVAKEEWILVDSVEPLPEVKND